MNAEERGSSLLLIGKDLLMDRLRKTVNETKFKFKFIGVKVGIRRKNMQWNGMEGIEWQLISKYKTRKR